MKYLYIFFLISINFSAYSQSVELFSGMTLNKYYDTNATRINDTKTYSFGSGVFIGLGIDQIEVSDLKFGVTINYERFSGDLMAFTGGNGGGRSVNAEITKSNLSIGFYPFDKKVFELINIRVGILYSKLLKDDFSGYIKTTVQFNSLLSTYEDLNESYQNYGTSSNLGFSVGLYRDIPLANNVFLSPQYLFYLGLSNEVRDFPRAAKSMRHYFGLGIKKKLE